MQTYMLTPTLTRTHPEIFKAKQLNIELLAGPCVIWSRNLLRKDTNWISDDLKTLNLDINEYLEKLQKEKCKNDCNLIITIFDHIPYNTLDI